jgi:hypothetical protein
MRDAAWKNGFGGGVAFGGSRMEGEIPVVYRGLDVEHCEGAPG